MFTDLNNEDSCFSQLMVKKVGSTKVFLNTSQIIFDFDVYLSTEW